MTRAIVRAATDCSARTREVSRQRWRRASLASPMTPSQRPPSSIRAHHPGWNPSRSSATKTADFQVLRETLCPAVLVECGFLSNPLDREMLTDSLEQWRMGAAIAVAVEDFQKIRKKFNPLAFADE